MTAIIDYGVGNLFSLCSSLKYIGEDAEVTRDAGKIRSSKRVILPGVGAFGDAALKLRDSGLEEIVVREAKSGKPLLGICVGMQLLFNKSLEYGEHEGLGLLEGVVSPIKPLVPEDYKIPHIGWNALSFTGGEKSSIFKYTDEGEYVYFVHSFHAEGCGCVTAVTEYGAELTAAAGQDNIYGTQFHPEKSGGAGLNILRAFCSL